MRHLQEFPLVWERCQNQEELGCLCSAPSPIPAGEGCCRWDVTPLLVTKKGVAGKSGSKVSQSGSNWISPQLLNWMWSSPSASSVLGGCVRELAMSKSSYRFVAALSEAPRVCRHAQAHLFSGDRLI